MEFIPYLFLSVLLGACIWLLIQIRDIVAKREGIKTFTLLDLALAYVMERDEYLFQKEPIPKRKENKDWCRAHSISPYDRYIFIFGYLEEWELMKIILNSLDLDDLHKKLVKQKFDRVKILKGIPVDSDEFSKEIAEVKAIEQQIEALNLLMPKRLPSPPAPPTSRVIKEGHQPPPPPRRPEPDKPNPA